MLTNVVGRTGSGKTLLLAYLAYEECTKIMRENKKHPWWFIGQYHSKYKKIALNIDFDDKRGNYSRWNYETKTWDSGGCVIGFTDLPELYKIYDVCVFIDEAGTQLSARDWDKMPEGYTLFLTSHRHNVSSSRYRFDIWLFTQQNDLVDIVLRRIAVRIWLVRPLFGFTPNPTKPNWFKTRPAIRIWLYDKHEVLIGKPYQDIDPDGKPTPLKKHEVVEALTHYTWYWFGKKYTSVYDTHSTVREIKRIKKV